MKDLKANSFGQACRRSFVALAASVLLCGLAQATVIFSGSLEIGAGDPTQLGRLSRNGVPQDWSNGEPFPGVINPAVSYHYTTLDLDLGALEAGYAFGGFLQIIFDSTFTTTFLSAYLTSYDPTDLSSHWLGDPGTSGNYFGVDPLFFQVVMGSTDHLILVLNESLPGGGLDLPGLITIEAYSDTEFTDLVRATPEPHVLLLLACGLALLMLARRSPRRAAIPGRDK
jgi:hypothetical protein